MARLRDALAHHALAVIAGASALSMVLLAARLAISWDIGLPWMAWNLFLAWVPLGLALAIARSVRSGAGRGALVALGLVWLAFLPNAPYLVTDLIHLRGYDPALAVLDLAMFSAFAATGLLIFVAAVHMVQRAAQDRLGSRAVRGFVPACIWLSSIGIYLGRVLRWNSWDLVTDPAGRAAGLVTHLGEPRTLALAVAFTLAVGAGLHAFYATVGRPRPGRRRVRST